MSKLIGIVSHDAGGAEIISSFVRRNSLRCIYALDGPAVEVFRRKLGDFENLSIHDLIDKCDLLYTGTSFLSDIEWRAWALGRSAGLRSISFVDHWVNYRQRFVRQDSWCWPDEVWVGDKAALQIASKTLPEVSVALVPNSYFLDILDEVKSFPTVMRSENSGDCILYVCEPLREDGLALYGNERYWGYTEEEAVIYFLLNINLVSKNIKRIIIRPHPQEPKNKYDALVEGFKLPIVCGENKTLLEQIAVSNIVVGCATMAMVVALMAGKRVISCIPPGGKTTSLPFADIENLSALLIN